MKGMKWLARAMMCLRRRESDASMHKPGWKAFSDFVTSLLGCAGSQASRLVHVASVSQHQGFALRTSTCALTSVSSGPQTLRCAPRLRSTNPGVTCTYENHTTSRSRWNGLTL